MRYRATHRLKFLLLSCFWLSCEIANAASACYCQLSGRKLHSFNKLSFIAVFLSALFCTQCLDLVSPYPFSGFSLIAFRGLIALIVKHANE